MKTYKAIIISVVIAAIGIFAVCFAAGKMLYNYGYEYYADKFFIGTSINGVDVSNMTVEQAKEAMQDHVRDYVLEIVERDNKTEEIKGADLSFEYVDDGTIETLFDEQDTELWQYHLNKTREYDIDAGFTYDKTALEKKVNALDCLKTENVVKSVNATIALNDNGFYIVPEVVGRDPDKDKLLTAVNQALSTSNLTLDLEEAGVYNDPTVVSTDSKLLEQLDYNNNMLTTSVVYDFKDRQCVCDKSVFKDWLQINSDGSVTIDRNQAYAWVSLMGYETDTFALARDFTTSTGETIKLEGGGDYGWYLDKDDTTDQLLAHIYNGDVLVCDPDYVYTACDRGLNDIGGTYVEVCIESQTLWCYKDYQLVVTTPVITGNVSTGHATPSGSVWAIDGKKTDFNFTQFASSCKYWLPFNDEVGLHDASWQAAENYTTTYYLTGGSHGCVNMPEEAAAKVFEVMEIGYPVVVYYSAAQVHGVDPTSELAAG